MATLTRSERIDEIHTKITEKLTENDSLDLEKFRAESAYNLDVTETKIQEYLNQLEKMDEIQINDDEGVIVNA